MKETGNFDGDDLILVGSKRDWVPMWLWIGFLFRFGVYEIWPISVLVYRKAPSVSA